MTEPADNRRARESGWSQRMRRRLWIVERLRLPEKHTLLLWAGFMGLLAALTSVAFRWLAEWLHLMLTGSGGSYVESMAALPAWHRVALLAGGGLMAGLILHGFSRWTRRAGPGDYMEAVVIGDGIVSSRVSITKTLSALFSVSSGASIGREGPLVQLAAMASSLTSRWRRFPPVKSRLLLACGAAAGIASAYNAPIAGALFVAEILLGSLSMETFGPLVFASVVATTASRQWLGEAPLYQVPGINLESTWDFIPVLLVSLVAGLIAPLFLRSLDLAARPFRKMPRWSRPAAGGLVVGLLACVNPGVCGNGHSIVNSLLAHHETWSAILTLFVLKWIATCLTFGSGTVGGVFTPTLFLGAAAGWLTVALCNLWGSRQLPFEPFVLVGMGAFLASTTHAPLMAILMIFEMTLDYQIILPLMLACVVSQQISQGLHPRSIYSPALRRKGAGLVDARLAKLKVRDLMRPDPPRVGVATPFSEVAAAFISRRITWLYVTQPDGTWLGAISLHDVKAFLQQGNLEPLVIAGDVMREDIPSLRPEQTLEEALVCFSKFPGEHLPVLSSDSQPLLTGSLAKNDLLLALAERPGGKGHA